jgi:hypothetical protein
VSGAIGTGDDRQCDGQAHHVGRVLGAAAPRLGALTVVFVFAGCSFFTVQGPKERGPHCTTGYAAPIVDMSAVATVAVLLTLALQSSDECDGNGCWPEAIASPLALVGGLNAASAIYGGVVVRSCNNHRERVAQDVATMVASLVPVAEAGVCDEVKRAVIVAEEMGNELGVTIALTNPAVLRCLAEPKAPSAETGTRDGSPKAAE